MNPFVWKWFCLPCTNLVLFLFCQIFFWFQQQKHMQRKVTSWNVIISILKTLFSALNILFSDSGFCMLSWKLSLHWKDIKAGKTPYMYGLSLLPQHLPHWMMQSSGADVEWCELTICSKFGNLEELDCFLSVNCVWYCFMKHGHASVCQLSDYLYHWLYWVFLVNLQLILLKYHIIEKV